MRKQSGNDSCSLALLFSGRLFRRFAERTNSFIRCFKKGSYGSSRTLRLTKIMKRLKHNLLKLKYQAYRLDISLFLLFFAILGLMGRRSSATRRVLVFIIGDVEARAFKQNPRASRNHSHHGSSTFGASLNRIVRNPLKLIKNIIAFGTSISISWQSLIPP